MTATAQHIGNEFADMACNGVQWLRNIRDGISTVDEALAEMEANLTRIRGLQAESYNAAVEEAAAAQRIEARRWVKGYYRTFRMWDGTSVKNEYTEFNTHHGVLSHPDGLLARPVAENLITYWNMQGNGHQVYSLEPQP